MSRILVLIGCALIMAGLCSACSDDKAPTDRVPPSIPIVVTATVSEVTETSAACGGTVTSDGGAEVTSRGVCWNASAIPTSADSTTTDGTGTGSFASTLTGLTPGTQYYLRAYATNEAGTGYGVTDSFTTVSLLQTRSTFDTDYEGWIERGEGVLYYVSGGGNPGGYIEFEDWEAGSGVFLAPEKFRGDLSAFGNGTLSFDLKNTVSNGNAALYDYGLIRITSGSLYAEKNVVPYGSYLTDWTTFSIPLDAASWGVTPAQWDSILVNVTELLIHMDPQNDFYDRSGLDNFTITAPVSRAAETCAISAPLCGR